MEEITRCSPEHQEVFRRVWERVMAGHPETGCPVEVAGDLSCHCLEKLTAPPPAAVPEGDRRHCDLPHAPAEQGPDGLDTAALRRQVLEALEGWQLYRHLASRTRGGTARALTELASHQHRHARKLSTAYFLLTGLRYWPSEMLAAPAIPSFWGTLRQRYQQEQQGELMFRGGGEDSRDPALRELYQELAEGCRDRQCRLRELLEQSCT